MPSSSRVLSNIQRFTRIFKFALERWNWSRGAKQRIQKYWEIIQMATSTDHVRKSPCAQETGYGKFGILSNLIQKIFDIRFLIH